jgi:hypothetical protein
MSAAESQRSEASPPHSLSTDPVVRTALLVRRFRGLGPELRGISGVKRDLIIKLWSHGATPVQIAQATDLPDERICRLLGIGDNSSAVPTITGTAGATEG